MTAILCLIAFAVGWYCRPFQLLYSWANHCRWIGPICLLVAPAWGGEPVNASYRVKATSLRHSDLGSGTAINKHWLITCRHVVQSAGIRGKVELLRGTSVLSGEVVQTDEPSDVAIVYCGAGFPEWVDLADSDPRPGDKVCIYGYGREGVLRGGTGTLVKLAGYRENGPQRIPVYQSSLWIQSGDSGSGMFNEAGELCGLNWGSEDFDGPANGIEGPSQSTGAVAIRAQCVYYETQCPGGWCPIIAPRQRPPQYAPQRPGGGVLAPVQPSSPAAPQQPTTPAPPAVVPPAKPFDDSHIISRLDLIEGRLVDIDKEPRPKPCECDPVAQQAAIMAAVKVTINEAIAGIKFPAPATPIPSEPTHFVVVGDPSAEYWRRLNDATKGATAVFNGIKTALPPTYPTGAMPALVQYRGAVPVAVFRGQREVEEKLDAIKRGDYPPAS